MALSRIVLLDNLSQNSRCKQRHKQKHENEPTYLSCAVFIRAQLKTVFETDYSGR